MQPLHPLQPGLVHAPSRRQRSAPFLQVDRSRGEIFDERPASLLVFGGLGESSIVEVIVDDLSLRANWQGGDVPGKGDGTIGNVNCVSPIEGHRQPSTGKLTEWRR